MLRWANDPDAVFHEIVSEVLAWALDWLAEGEQVSTTAKGQPSATREADQHYHDGMPRTAKLLHRREAVDVLKRLLDAHRDRSARYQVTDYHWLILYEVLQWFTDVAGDLDGSTTVGPYRVGRFDFGAILDHYFWDLDFMLDAIAQAPEDLKRLLGVSRETWGLVSGLKPHPAELAVTPVTDEGAGPFEPRPGPKTRRLAAYPPEEVSAEWYYGK